MVVTSDNPRSENPLAIICQVLLGLSHRDAVHVQADRAAAITHALSLAGPEDVVLLAGKGHESFQEVGGVKLPSPTASMRRRRSMRWPQPGTERHHDAPATSSGLAARTPDSWATAACRPCASTPTRAACRPATCSWRSRASVSTPTTSSRRPRRKARSRRLPTTGWRTPACRGWKWPTRAWRWGSWRHGWRSQFRLPLVAVTGSNGKTTVTQMIASILRAWKADKAFATEGNLNNDIGVPLTLLRLSAAHEVGVVELGMNHPGEIAYLAELSQPTVALVNNAQREHLEFMATVEAVARENGSVFRVAGCRPARRSFRPTTTTRRCGASWSARARC